ncbi:unnamed protein product [Rotaria sp. Silwood1]|nr:unnamed protein product [Rotaria sp. Silwood1]CAF1670632.1 unnamed protein product [Rotaria sp. Silwood1]
MPPLQLTLEEQICAIVSDLAYAAHKDTGIEGRYSYDRVQTALNNHINKKRARGDEVGANALSEYKVSDNHEHTNQNIVTLVNKKAKKVIVGYRGTMLSWRGIVYDIFLNNTLVAFNSFGGRRSLTALEHTQRVKNDFGHGYELIVTGHSLGGSNANFVSKILNVRGIGFNIGSAVLEDPEYKTLAGICNHEDKFVNIRIKGDVISSAHKGISRTYDGIPGGIDFSGVQIHAWLNPSINIGTISGAVFAGSIATLHTDGSPDSNSTITMQDFAVGLLLAHFRKDPAFSLDPWEPTNPDGPWLRCVYYPEYNDNNQSCLPFSLAQTNYGRTMFEADWLLKQLSMGVNLDQYNAAGPFPSPLPIRIFPASLLALGLRDRFELESHQTSLIGDEQNARYTRLWITVDHEKTLEALFPSHETCSNQLASYSEQIAIGSSIAIHFSDVKLGVQVMRMTRGITGQLEDLLDPRLVEPTSSDVIFASLMTNHYDEVAQHFPPLRRLKELAKLQAVAKWMIENDVDVDIEAALKCIRESAPNAIEKVPALERKNVNTRIFGGVNLSVRQQYHDRAEPYLTLEKNEQTQLKNMVHRSLTITTSTEKASSTIIPLPFVKKKFCSVCNKPLDFSSFFKPSTSSSDVSYCDEHHPNACYGCMLPLYIDPISLTQITDGSYKVITVQNCRYHPACFLCAACNLQIDNESYINDPDVMHVYYHSNCYSPLLSHNQQNRNKKHQLNESNHFISYNEQIELEKALSESKQIYELQKKNDQFVDHSGSNKNPYSFRKHQTNEQDQWEDEDLARVLSLSTLESSSFIRNNAELRNQSEDEEDIQLAKNLSLFTTTTKNAPSMNFVCEICRNNFNKESELEEHVQLHFDN